MSDKMMTPDEYLRENPTHILAENELDGHTYAEYVKDKKRVGSDFLQIDWTGYTEPHVMIGPEFPQSRKREVEWMAQVYKSHHNLSGVSPTRKLTAENGDSYWQVGKYIDAPVKSKPELSRFLPDGCKWIKDPIGNWCASHDEWTLWNNTILECWHNRGLLHPSEGGGFQKHNPGDPMPCDKIMIDLIWDDEMIVYEVPYDFSKLDSGGAICIGWRPHYKEQN
jgi:hypothetical protein